MNIEMYRVTRELPEGQSGIWKVQKYTVTEKDEKFQRLRCAINPHREQRFVPAGEYTQLVKGGTIIMSDTPDEIYDQYPLLYAAHGNVLINGLGLGCTIKMCMSKPEVTHVTVVEIDPDVIRLTGDFWKQKYKDRLTIINADAFDYKPAKGSYFGAVWHDIWDNICGDNLPEMSKLHRRYGRMSTWQGSWGRILCKQGR